ncbi:MAG: MurT ligase domain-containing protein [Coriobacteriia bacterium]|nr:MurT ligase domain-containing protein [Coriobacteriia bacterium]
MGFRYSCACAVGAVATWGLKNVFHRTAGNFPGKVGLMIDPQLIRHLRSRIRKGCIVVVGTNGKTTVNNMIADCIENADGSVVCNREGANLDSGVATALLHSDVVDWGVIESDELWLAHSLPQLKASYVVLLNLFRDQLDRCGEIDRVQDAIVGALKNSPETMLIYNADDPQCCVVANKVQNETLAFGINEDLHLPQNTVSDAQMCQECEGMLAYEYRQYGQLGNFRCTQCDFKRPPLDFALSNVTIGEEGTTFTITPEAGEPWALSTPFGGAYMVYNVAAVAIAAQLAGCSLPVVQSTVNRFSPANGRLQSLTVGGRQVLLNLAKNPTGFNQNLKLVTQGEGPRAVAFFINDQEADGHDISWLWDIDFEELAARDDLVVFAGGQRANDMQVRLKYAGINAQVVTGARDMFVRISNLPVEVKAYLIANYTALPAVKRETEDLAAQGERYALHLVDQAECVQAKIDMPQPDSELQPLVIAHLFPDLLNLYGDGGNVTVLQRRMQWRGLPVEVRRVQHGESVDLSQVDLVFLGGGPDREQRLASQDLVAMADQLKAFVESDGVLLAICGGYQILGSTWLLGEEDVPGLGIIDLRTGRAEGGSGNRLIENIVLHSDLAKTPVVGYENHAGRTYLGAGVKPFGSVVSSVGHGNNDTDKADGARYKNVVGTYLHGPLLGKNPEVADALLRLALTRQAARLGTQATQLPALDDSVELAANRVMCTRLHVE